MPNQAQPKIRWKSLKYKHRKRALGLYAVLNPDENGQVNLKNFSPAEVVNTEGELTRLVMSLVLDWDFVDVESGEPIPPGEPDELSDEQYFAVMDEFNVIMDRAKVKKTKDSVSSSGPSGFDTAKPRKKTRKTG